MVSPQNQFLDDSQVSCCSQTLERVGCQLVVVHRLAVMASKEGGIGQTLCSGEQCLSSSFFRRMDQFEATCGFGFVMEVVLEIKKLNLR